MASDLSRSGYFRSMKFQLNVEFRLDIQQISYPMKHNIKILQPIS